LKGLVLGLLEVGGDNFVYKTLKVVDLEGFSIVDPRNNICMDLVLVDSLEHLIKLPSKGQFGRRQVWILGET